MQVVERILKRRIRILRIDTEAAGQSFQKALSVGWSEIRFVFFIGQQLAIVPHGDAILAPKAGERPAWQRFARIPLAGSKMEQCAGREPGSQPLDQPPRELALFRAHGGVVPLFAVHIVDGDEGRLTAHGQPDVVLPNLGVHVVTQSVDALPLRVGIGKRDPRILMDARDRHFMNELDFARAHAAAHRRGRGGLGRRG